ncbi:unnamed protein product [Bursaphelenchus okinawaensis]|uniref:Uncharacterized protein n=1 Tax=Bursaphelenchus okinawaensis TaxID=465554 RepID=A0A811KVL6_9BILA|nr:unnamed protein product [Bursaphelenchus okinawaensis]CAG9112109.1 unnamed protein product [Bursaphelenchus okinawaensis]
MLKSLILLSVAFTSAFVVEKNLNTDKLNFLGKEDVTHVLSRFKELGQDTKTALLLAFEVGCNVTLEDHEDFKKFFLHIIKYKKTYSTDAEVRFRFNVVKDSLRKVEKYQKENPEAQYGLTKLSDLTSEEFHRSYANLDYKAYKAARLNSKNSTRKAAPIKEDLPQHHDWREQGKVTSIKDQVKCGACFAFAAVGAIEGMHAIRHNELVDLSVQQSLSCGNNKGCGGGDPNSVLEYHTDHEIARWDDYPYVVGNGEAMPPCDETKPGVTSLDRSGWLDADEEVMRSTVFNNGPIVVGIDGERLKEYQGGIMHGEHGELNHAVLVVGYGFEPEDHWLIKNSWGTGWGDDGYARIGRNKNDLGIGEQPLAAYIDN